MTQHTRNASTARKAGHILGSRAAAHDLDRGRPLDPDAAFEAGLRFAERGPRRHYATAWARGFADGYLDAITRSEVRTWDPADEGAPSEDYDVGAMLGLAHGRGRDDRRTGGWED